MPAQGLNFALTTDTYTDANTVVFPTPRDAFSVQVSNAAIFYTLAYILPIDPRDHARNARMQSLAWDFMEHHTVQALLVFTDAVREGLPDGSWFAGIKVRSAATDVPARVTIA